MDKMVIVESVENQIAPLVAFGCPSAVVVR
jgi:hypothetical protein